MKHHATAARILAYRFNSTSPPELRLELAIEVTPASLAAVDALKAAWWTGQRVQIIAPGA